MNAVLGLKRKRTPTAVVPDVNVRLLRCGWAVFQISGPAVRPRQRLEARDLGVEGAIFLCCRSHAKGKFLMGQGWQTLPAMAVGPKDSCLSQGKTTAVKQGREAHHHAERDPLAIVPSGLPPAGCMGRRNFSSIKPPSAVDLLPRPLPGTCLQGWGCQGMKGIDRGTSGDSPWSALERRTTVFSWTTGRKETAVGKARMFSAAPWETQG